MSDAPLFGPDQAIGDYLIVRFVARGGQGEVYQAFDRKKRRIVALKIFAGDENFKRGNPGLSVHDWPMRMAFSNEFAFLSKLSKGNPQIVKVYGKGKNYKDLDRGGIIRPYFAMELLHPFNPKEDFGDETRVKKFILSVCSVVKALHRQKFCHQDLKLSNIMQRENGELVLIDLGVCEKIDSDALDCLQSGKVASAKGTIGIGNPYEPPSVTKDIAAIGSLIKRCFNDVIPLFWMRIMAKCWDPDVRCRFQTVEELEEAVGQLRDERTRTYNILWKENIRNQYRQQSESAKYPMIPCKLAAILHKGEKPREIEKKAWVWRIDLSDDPNLRCKHIYVPETLKLERGVVLVVTGPGILDLNLSGPEGSAVVATQEIVLHNRSRAFPPSNSCVYVLTGRAYLNFTNLKRDDYDRLMGNGRRVLKSITEATALRLGGPETWANIRDAHIKEIYKTSMPEDWKHILEEYFSAKRFSLP